MFIYAVAIIGSIVNALSDFSLKTYVQTHSNNYLFLGILGYALTGLFFSFILRHYDMTTANIIWHVFHGLLLFLATIFISKHTFTFREIVGLCFGVVAIFLLAHH